MDPRTLRDFPNDDLRQKIADLERSSAVLAGDIAACEHRAGSLRAEWSRQTTHLNTIRNELERRLTPPPAPRISDHALLRFLDRVLDIDVESIRAQILTESVAGAIRAGATSITVHGVKFVVQGATIVTTLGEDQRLKRKTGKHGRPAQLTSDAAAIAEGVANYYEERASNGAG